MKFPKTIYVEQEGEGEDAFLLVAESPKEIAEIGETIEAAEYELVKKVAIKTNVEVA